MLTTLLTEIDHFKPPRPHSPHLQQQLKEYYRIGLVYSSNALEGNTLTESETKVVLEEGLTVSGKPLRDHLEAQGLSAAYDLLYELLASSSLTLAHIHQLHALFYQKIDPIQAGVYRTVPVIITGSQYPTTPPLQIAAAMTAMLQSLNAQRPQLHPLVFAAELHKAFVFIHPFIDGNGRVARLLVNLVLMQAGYQPLIIPPLQRAAYISSLEKAHTDDQDFRFLLAQALRETQRDYLRLLRASGV